MYRKGLNEDLKKKAFKEFEYQALLTTEHKLYNTDLAERFGVTPHTISKWKSEWKRLRIEEAIKTGM